MRHLANVCKGGSADGSVSDRVYSQATYFIMVADKNLMSGKPGRFNLVDARSHRLGKGLPLYFWSGIAEL